MAMTSRHTPMPDDLWDRATKAANARAQRVGGGRMSTAEFIRQAIVREIEFENTQGTEHRAAA